jgi:hypothetical protein
MCPGQRMGITERRIQQAPAAKSPKIAGSASPVGSGDLKKPGLPPSQALPCRDLSSGTAARQRDLFHYLSSAEFELFVSRILSFGAARAKGNHSDQADAPADNEGPASLPQKPGGGCYLETLPRRNVGQSEPQMYICKGRNICIYAPTVNCECRLLGSDGAVHAEARFRGGLGSEVFAIVTSASPNSLHVFRSPLTDTTVPVLGTFVSGHLLPRFGAVKNCAVLASTL